MVIKRNGSKAEFDSYKITIAILSAFNETKEGNHEIAQNLTQKVVDKIHNENINVEDIQDIVEETLMQEGFLRTAKNYILYRQEHKQQRDFESDLMKRIAKLSKETNRDNANVGHSSASKMYQIGGEASKAYYLNKLIPKNLSRLHIEGLIHIHDLDYYDKTFNCISIPLTRMLKNLIDYEFEYGSIRTPKRLDSAMALASIILQRISNDIFGGTMLPNIDIMVQELIVEKYINVPTDIEIEQGVQSLLYNLATMNTRAGKIDCRFQ